MVEHLARVGPFERRERAAVRLVVYRAAVVGIDQREIPQVASLVNIRHAGHGEFQNRLRKRVDDPHLGNAFGHRLKRPHERIGSLAPLEQRGDEFSHTLVPPFVGLHPTAVDLRLLDGLGHVLLDAPDVDRVFLRAQRGKRRFCRVLPFPGGPHGPGTEQNLVKQIFLVEIGCLRGVSLNAALVLAVERAPAS